MSRTSIGYVFLFFGLLSQAAFAAVPDLRTLDTCSISSDRKRVVIGGWMTESPDTSDYRTKTTGVFTFNTLYGNTAPAYNTSLGTKTMQGGITGPSTNPSYVSLTVDPTASGFQAVNNNGRYRYLAKITYELQQVLTVSPSYTYNIVKTQTSDIVCY